MENWRMDSWAFLEQNDRMMDCRNKLQSVAADNMKPIKEGYLNKDGPQYLGIMRHDSDYRLC